MTPLPSASAPRAYVQNAPPCVDSKRPCVYRHHAACGNTCARGAGTYGDVLNLHTGTPHTPQHTPHTRTTHNNTRRQTDRDRENKRRRQRRDKRREEGRERRKRERRRKREENPPPSPSPPCVHPKHLVCRFKTPPCVDSHHART